MLQRILGLRNSNQTIFLAGLAPLLAQGPILGLARCGGGNKDAACEVDADLDGRSAKAVDALISYLDTPVHKRKDISRECFSKTPLSEAHAIIAQRYLQQDHFDRLTTERYSEHAANSIKLDGFTMDYRYEVFGDEPFGGHSLYISLHGGGAGPSHLNDEQWENQQDLYQPREGIYLSPRAPTDTWNMWHRDHIDRLLDRLIANMIVFEGINPDRIYIMGYSAGGDGVYQLAPRMADRWAAAAMSAGHPNDASPLGLRNIGFTIHVGADDGAYNRNGVALAWKERLEQLQDADPTGYAHEVTIHRGFGHWLYLHDAVALDWMAEYTRDAYSERIVWKQDDVNHQRFYWLAVQGATFDTGEEIAAAVDGNIVSIEAPAGARLNVRLHDNLVNLDEPVTVMVNGTVQFEGMVGRTIDTIARTLEERGDPAAVFVGEVSVEAR